MNSKRRLSVGGFNRRRLGSGLGGSGFLATISQTAAVDRRRGDPGGTGSCRRRRPLAAGAAKTHRFVLYLHTRRDREYRRIVEAILTGPPVGVLAPSWYEKAGVFAQPFAPLPDQHPEEYTEVILLKARSQVDLVNIFGPPAHGVRINPRHWGFFNYGDLETTHPGPEHPGRRYWNNNYYDLPYLLLQEFIRTGDPVFLSLAGPALAHLGDVDLVHPSGRSHHARA